MTGDVEALAEALHNIHSGCTFDIDNRRNCAPNRAVHRREAEAILAALPEGWHLTREAAQPDAATVAALPEQGTLVGYDVDKEIDDLALAIHETQFPAVARDLRINDVMRQIDYERDLAGFMWQSLADRGIRLALAATTGDKPEPSAPVAALADWIIEHNGAWSEKQRPILEERIRAGCDGHWRAAWAKVSDEAFGVPETVTGKGPFVGMEEQQRAVQQDLATFTLTRIADLPPAMGPRSDAMELLNEAKQIARNALAALDEELRIQGDPEAPDHPENRCQRCHGRNIVWSAPDELWNEVMGGEAGILCPICFAELADVDGPRTPWRLEPAARADAERLIAPYTEALGMVRDQLLDLGRLMLREEAREWTERDWEAIGKGIALTVNMAVPIKSLLAKQGSD